MPARRKYHAQAHRLHASGIVDVRNRYTETLQFAAAIIGGTERLAKFLDVPRKDVVRWLAGEAAPPDQVFLDALDVIADGPYAHPDRRRPRVSVLDLPARGRASP